MASQKLSLIVDLINNTEAGFKSLAANVDAAKKKTEATTAAMRQTGVVGAIAFGAIAFEANAALKAASESADVQNQLQAVITSTGNAAGVTIEALNAQASAIERMTTYSDEAVGSAQALLLTFTNIRGQTLFDTTQSVIDLAAAMHEDLQSASIQVGKALNNPLTGMLQLQRVGVTFSAQQKEMVKQLIATGDTLGAQKIILGELNKEFGGSAAAAAKSFGGSMLQLKNQIDNVQESIGRALQPALQGIVTSITPVAIAFGQWIDKNPKVASTIITVAAAVAGLLVVLGALGVIIPAVSAGAVAMGAVFTTFGAILTYLSTTTVTQFAIAIGRTLVSAFSSLVVSIFGANAALFSFKSAMIATGVGAFVILLGYIIVQFMELVKVTGSVSGSFKLMWEGIIFQTYNALATIAEAIANLTSKIPLVSGAMSNWASAFRGSADDANKAMDVTAAALAKGGESVKSYDQIMAEMNSKVKASTVDLSGEMKKQTEKVSDYVKGMADALKAVRDDIKGVYDDMKKQADDFNKNIVSENKDYATKVVEIVAGAKVKAADLQTEIGTAASKGDDTTDLQKQLAEQNSIISSYSGMNMDLNQRVADQVTYLRSNALVQAQIDHKNKVDQLQADFLAEQAASFQKLELLNKENDSIMKMMDAQTAKKVATQLAQTTAFRDSLSAQSKGLTTWTQQSLSQYQSYATQVNAILATIKSSYSMSGTTVGVATSTPSGARASGGPVSPGRTFLVGENGPELFTPTQAGTILANGSGGSNITVIFSDNVFSDADYADKIQSRIVNDLKAVMKLSIS